MSGAGPGSVCVCGFLFIWRGCGDVGLIPTEIVYLSRSEGVNKSETVTAGVCSRKRSFSEVVSEF